MSTLRRLLRQLKSGSVVIDEGIQPIEIWCEEKEGIFTFFRQQYLTEGEYSPHESFSEKDFLEWLDEASLIVDGVVLGRIGDEEGWHVE